MLSGMVIPGDMIEEEEEEDKVPVQIVIGHHHLVCPHPHSHLMEERL